MDANIDLMIIITNKKCVTRYFKTQGQNLQSAGPGTIVTETIVDKSKFDFYLVSQQVKQGSAQPTHYKVLYTDFMPAQPEHIFELTYKLCYLYYHTNAGIKIPAPVQYAQRLSKLVGEKINAKGGPELIVPGERFLTTPTLFFI